VYSPTQVQKISVGEYHATNTLSIPQAVAMDTIPTEPVDPFYEEQQRRQSKRQQDTDSRWDCWYTGNYGNYDW
jgi:hypothetical protein